MAELTPMMKQYLEIKKDNPDSILFFRLGDFYEMFADDAKLASRELDLTLTSRDHGKHEKPPEERVPMCGIPYHASEAYIARLIQKGYKVAICEQMEDPAAAKGLVKRDIIRVVTPGTVIDQACLEDKASNFLCGIYIDSRNAGAAFCDISTGKTHLTAFDGPERVEHVVNELGRFSPAEGRAQRRRRVGEAADRRPWRTSSAAGWRTAARAASASRRRRGTSAASTGEEAFDRLPKNNPAAAHGPGGAAPLPVRDPEDGPLPHQRPGLLRAGPVHGAGPDRPAEPGADRDPPGPGRRRGSLLWVLDKTRTPMGGRLLRSWLERPLLSVTAIVKRNAAVAALVENTLARES